MAFQTVFKRYELKYLLTTEQKERIVSAIAPFMEADSYGRTTIRNIYFDTDSYALIRRSIEKPAYKEKLRIRSYKLAERSDTVFVELKKKYQSVVYKRRISLCESEAMEWVTGEHPISKETQISREIDYFRSLHENLSPTVFLSYDRDAFYSIDDKSFRVTFDDNILCRMTDLSLTSDVYGMPILEADKCLMEIKCSGGMPLWMARLLSEERIYKTSFSKYGTAYASLIFPKTKNALTGKTDEKEIYTHA